MIGANLPRSDAEWLLRNLLAVIHRDGGHHTLKVGLEQSVADAERALGEYIREQDAKRTRRRR